MKLLRLIGQLSILVIITKKNMKYPKLSYEIHNSNCLWLELLKLLLGTMLMNIVGNYESHQI